ncbi:hypothetical protein E2C01_069240 [Portunus trituberculatus]|uniref:Uncharacterized protein n=1 Tax=Portunus trituberculatus TaxID=210409 RepID=A0A5B7HPJ6_PORTR|nr:hypothetical protein [Portunus trituberculatus]
MSALHAHPPPPPPPDSRRGRPAGCRHASVLKRPQVLVLLAPSPARHLQAASGLREARVLAAAGRRRARQGAAGNTTTAATTGTAGTILREALRHCSLPRAVPGLAGAWDGWGARCCYTCPGAEVGLIATALNIHMGGAHLRPLQVRHTGSATCTSEGLVYSPEGFGREGAGCRGRVGGVLPRGPDTPTHVHSPPPFPAH